MGHALLQVAVGNNICLVRHDGSFPREHRLGVLGWVRVRGAAGPGGHPGGRQTPLEGIVVVSLPSSLFKGGGVWVVAALGKLLEGCQAGDVLVDGGVILGSLAACRERRNWPRESGCFYNLPVGKNVEMNM